MKEIQPVQIWNNGQMMQAKILKAYAVNVSLNTSATFYYSLMAEENGTQGVQLAEGNLTMDGDDYQQWDADTFAWGWIASQLNLTIVGDYAPETE